MENKRKEPSSPTPLSGGLIKRTRVDGPPQGPGNAIAISSGADVGKALVRSVKRTSSLDAPIVSLAGAHGVRFCALAGAGLGLTVAGRRRY